MLQAVGREILMHTLCSTSQKIVSDNHGTSYLVILQVVLGNEVLLAIMGHQDYSSMDPRYS